MKGKRHQGLISKTYSSKSFSIRSKVFSLFLTDLCLREKVNNEFNQTKLRQIVYVIQIGRLSAETVLVELL